MKKRRILTQRGQNGCEYSLNDQLLFFPITFQSFITNTEGIFDFNFRFIITFSYIISNPQPLSSYTQSFIIFMQYNQRPKQLTTSDIHKLKYLPQYLYVNSVEFVLYNMVDKQSNSGLFKNERILLLNTKQQSLFYLSKPPQSLIPFIHEDEVNTIPFKQKLTSSEVYQGGINKFLCQKRQEKNEIEIKLQTSNKKLEWVFYFHSKPLMEEWYNHIQFIFTKSRNQVDQRYHPKIIQEQQHHSPPKTEQPNKEYKQTQQFLPQDSTAKVHQDALKRLPASQIQEVKQPNPDKQSQFDQFEQNAPLGRFIREDIKYNTENANQNNHSIEGSLIVSHKSQGKEVNAQSFQQFLNSQKKKNKENPQIAQQNYNSFQTDWNQLYYSSRDTRSDTYFSFLNQAIKFARNLVDSLPLTKQIDKFQHIQSYFYTSQNGILYKIAFIDDDKSLIDQLNENKASSNDYYKIYEDLKQQFYEQRKQFFKRQQQIPHLSCFIDYKGLSFLCRASLSRQYPTSQGHYLKRSIVHQDTILAKLQSLDLFIVSSADFQDIMRYLNAPSLNWGYMYTKSTIKSFKVHFINEMFSQVFTNILKGQLCNIYHSDLFLKLQSQAIVEEAVNDSILMLVNRLFGKGNECDQLWDIIFLEVQRKYGIQATKESILPGYLLYSIIHKLGMKIEEGVNMKNTFILFKNNKSLQKEHVIGFGPKVSCLNYELMSSLFQQIKQNLQSTQENNEQLQLLISNEQYERIPIQVNYLAPKVKIQLSKSKAYDESGKNILIYQSLPFDNPTSNNYEIVLSAMNWLLVSNKYQAAKDLSFIKIQELIFWSGKVPIISLFYECFADYYIARQQFEIAIDQIKLSLKNLSQIFGPFSSKLLERKKELCDLYLSLNRKQESLKELYECKGICQTNKFQESATYIQILMKIAKLNLFFSKYTESINHSMTCLKELQTRVDSQDAFAKEESACQFLEVGQLLLRAFELTNKREELFQVISLCSQRCQNVNSIRAYKRLFKIVLFPFLKRLSLKESQVYMMIVQELNAAYKQSSFREEQLYTCIKERRLLKDITQRLKGFFKNLNKFFEEITKKRLLQDLSYSEVQDFRNRSDRNQVQTFIKQTFLMSNLIGIGFIQGMLKDVYYE